jgi:cytochrome c peroxidase
MFRPLFASLLALLLAAGCSTPTPARDAESADAADVPDAGRDGAPDTGLCVPDAGPYPPGPYDLTDDATLPDLRFETADGMVSLREYYQPCAATPRLLVIRTLAAWSGPSQWHASHTTALLTHPSAARLAVLDLLALGATNLPATTRDLVAWRARYDQPPGALAIDPEYRFRAVFIGARQLPIVVLVDTRTMRAARILVAPASDDLAYAITATLARMDGRPVPPRGARALYDDRFSPDQLDMIRAMGPAPAPPADPTNRYADDPNAAALGRALFSDPRLVPSGRVSCASCHQAARAFTDGLPRSIGLREVDRNAPGVLFAAHQRWQFWDGRADSLWAQALGPFENAAEMGSSRLFIAHAVKRYYREQYTAVFGSLPPLEEGARFPAEGKPGDAAWEAMAPADREAVTRVYVNVGKAIAAFERTLRARPTPLDAYAAGDVTALSPRARDGLHHFFEFGCIQCHHGPLLTDDSFHNVAMPTGRLDEMPDDGRIAAIATLLANPFRADGAFSDAPGTAAHLADLAPVEAMRGQFHTPPLRAVMATGPWGHGGTFARMEDVMLHYARRSMPTPVPGTSGTQDLHLGSFHEDPETIGALVDLMRAMTPDPVLP